VTAVDRSAKLETLKSIGADHVIDHTHPDYRIAAEPYDLIFDVVCRLPLARYLGMLRPAGRLVLANPQTSHFFCGLWTSNTTDQKIIFSSEQASDQDLPFLLGLVESGQLRPVLDRAFPLEAMAEAHRYAETEAKVGNIVITVQA
jgi:NADPH:quinone reductase-like Zn-dependent oxidoreductase